MTFYHILGYVTRVSDKKMACGFYHINGTSRTKDEDRKTLKHR